MGSGSGSGKDTVKRRRIALILIIFIALGIFYLVRYFSERKASDNSTIVVRDNQDTTDRDNFIKVSVPTTNDEISKIEGTDGNYADSYVSSDHLPVYITGKVVTPGVYRVPPGSILNDLVVLAGGLDVGAAPDKVNLACKLHAHHVYQIPGKEDNIDPSAPLYAEDSAPASQKASVININVASAKDLEGIPGIGPATADAIIRYREEHGSFKKTTDIMKIRGIKEERYRHLLEYITVDGN